MPQNSQSQFHGLVGRGTGAQLLLAKLWVSLGKRGSAGRTGLETAWKCRSTGAQKTFLRNPLGCDRFHRRHHQ